MPTLDYIEDNVYLADLVGEARPNMYKDETDSFKGDTNGSQSRVGAPSRSQAKSHVAGCNTVEGVGYCVRRKV